MEQHICMEVCATCYPGAPVFQDSGNARSLDSEGLVVNDDVLSQPNTELPQDLEAIVHTEDPSKPKVVNLQAPLAKHTSQNVQR